MSTLSMPKNGTVMIPLAKIENRFDVRMALDDDRVLQFAGMYESGMSLPPVELVSTGEDGNYAYVDGRHRGAARAFLNYADIEATIRPGTTADDPIGLYASALRANWGGAKPPSRGDIIHTIIRLVELNIPQSEIRKRLDFLPSGSSKAYISTAVGTVQKRRLALALDAVADGLSAEAAAELHGIQLETLQNTISGKKGKFGNRSDEQQYTAEIKSYISQKLFAANAGISNKIGSMLKRVEDGEVSATLAESVIKAWQTHLRQTNLRIVDWQHRLRAITTEQEKAAPASAIEANTL
jgi:hypothetical protein